MKANIFCFMLHDIADNFQPTFTGHHFAGQR